ncbi:SUKH-3 domain-containing protein [Actinoplanes teichomyceticus]|uniref:SUKH-3 immunity protein of toxin-antitoxin system n=1 Tax=Actinoplanes teichomyceticus TaxID=1867 RepID=A0A561VKU1_ACTTI|nr:SUKH-3 domain-containing protein [Actinoplanes teichomyceticus]TWG12200.1 SUKH-3 immunity protein of toxin-antitoxin system [Actinoplanes teichomyceticus]
MDGAVRLHGETRQILKDAGWHVNRAVDTERWEAELVADGFAPLHPVAMRFLAEFGGLTVPDGGAGVTRARESFTLTPTDCRGEADSFVEWGEDIGRSIAPIGVLAGGTCAWANLGIDEQGEVYVVSSALATFGRMPRALDRLVLGHMPRDLN